MLQEETDAKRQEEEEKAMAGGGGLAAEQEQEQEQEQEEEQQKEQQVEQEVQQAAEPTEEPSRQKYSRDDEAHVPWLISNLDRPPMQGEARAQGDGFYPWSEFRIFHQAHGAAAGTASAITPSLGLKFPNCLQLSSNFYKPKFEEKPRRIKNLIVAMEWKPNGMAPGGGGMAPEAAGPLPPTAVEQLRAIFRMMGGSDAAGMPSTTVWELWRAMELDVDDPNEQARLQAAAVAAGVGGPTCTFDQLACLMHPSVLTPPVGGRYVVALTLLEAESMRYMLHARQGRPFSPVGGAATVALHLLRSSSTAGNAAAVLLGSSMGHAPASDGEWDVAQQCLRYIDAEMDFDTAETSQLLRGLQENECAAREAFFGQVVASRRRVQQGWAQRSVARIFSLDHEFAFLHHYALMGAVREALRERQLPSIDAFRAFNASQNGLISCSELYGGLVWLGMDVKPPNVYELVRQMDKDDDGLVSWDEWLRAIGRVMPSEAHSTPGDEDLDAILAARTDLDLASLRPIPIRELYDREEEDEGDSELASTAAAMMPQLATQIKFKLQKLERFDEVWRSAGIAGKAKVSVWEARLATKRLQRNRQRVCVGHFCSGSYSAPRGDRFALELTDLGVSGVQTSKWLGLVVKQQMPHPSRYHLVWALQSGTTPVFFWQPVPADALTHVALGMVATLSEEAPSTKLVHCVPRAWVEPAPDDVKMVWQDSGAGGKPGSLWSVGSLGLLAAAQATRPPVEMSWRLRRTRFWLGESEAGGGGGHHTVVGADIGQEMQFSVRTLAESSISSYPGSVRLSEAPGAEPTEYRSHLASVDEGDIGRMPSPSFTSANTRMTENL